MTTKDYFKKGIFNYISILSVIIVVFFGAFYSIQLSIFLFCLVVLSRILVVSWRSNIITVAEKLIVRYPYWIFYNRNETYDWSNIESIYLNRYSTDVRANPHFDIFFRNGFRNTKRIHYPEFNDEEFNEFSGSLRIILSDRLTINNRQE